jgi:putative glutamine amidotransferase
MKIAVSVSRKEKAKGEQSPYYQALRAVGVGPEEIELLSATDSRRAQVEAFDGILFTGGEDVDPGSYGEEKKYPSVQAESARDDFEFALLDRALSRRLPILGICRGMQMINVKFGGTLYQDLEEQKDLKHKQAGSRSAPLHGVTVTDPDSLLAGSLPGSCRVNSLHHQGVKRLGRGLKATAHSEDGLYEAVESAEDYPFLLAVQWHPEEMVDRPEQRAIFEQFVARCRARATRGQ